MTGISRHIIVFLYIVTFFSGVSCFTLVAFAAGKAKNSLGSRYASLRSFIAALFIFLTVNFLMFYREYFFLNTQMNIAILFLFDVSLVSISYYWIKYNNVKELDAWLPFIKKICFIYPAVWLAVYILKAASYGEGFAMLRGCLALSADAVFCFLIIGCAIYSAHSHIRENNDAREKKYFTTLNISFSAYLLYMYFVDLITVLAEFEGENLPVNDFYFLDPIIFLFLITNIYTTISLLGLIKENSMPADGIPEISGEYRLEKSREIYHLTQRETEMVGLVLEGMSNPQISGHLSISNSTVKRHMNNIFKKTNAKSRFELIRLIENEKK